MQEDKAPQQPPIDDTFNDQGPSMQTNFDEASFPPTFGEKLTGITFNPSNSEKVYRVKKLCAELANIAYDCHFNKEDCHTSLEHHLYINTIGEILNAQMNVVKLITFQY